MKIYKEKLIRKEQRAIKKVIDYMSKKNKELETITKTMFPGSTIPYIKLGEL